MAKRDPERTKKIRIAVRYLMERDCLAKGNQSRLAEHFHVSRQRVHQIVVEERRRAGLTDEPAPRGYEGGGLMPSFSLSEQGA